MKKLEIFKSRRSDATSMPRFYWGERRDFQSFEQSNLLRQLPSGLPIFAQTRLSAYTALRGDSNKH